MNLFRKLFGKKINGKSYVQTKLEKVKKHINITLNTPESIQLRKDYLTFINILYSKSPDGFIKHMNDLLDEYETAQTICSRKCVSFNAHKGQDITNLIKQMTTGPNYGHAANFCVGTTVDDIGKKGISMTLVDELIDACAKINTQKDEIQQLIYMWFVGGEEEKTWLDQFDQVLQIIERAQSLFRETTSSGKPNYIYTVRLNNMLKLKNPTPQLKASPKAPSSPKAMSSIKSSLKTRKMLPIKPPKPNKKAVSPKAMSSIKSSLKTRKMLPIKPPKPTKKLVSPKAVSPNKTQKCGKGLRCKKDLIVINVHQFAMK